MPFIRAEKMFAKLRLWLYGISNSGKSYSALRLFKGIGGKTAMINTETGRGEIYGNEFEYDIKTIQRPFTIDKYIEAIDEAVAAGYDNIIVDSVSHEWDGSGGILEKKGRLDEIVGSNHFTNWLRPGREHDRFIEYLTHVPAHLICTARAKSDHILIQNEKGKMEPKKVGLAPIMRPGLEYEMLVAFEINGDHMARVIKDNTQIWKDVGLFQITEKDGVKLMEWLNSGIEQKIWCIRCEKNFNKLTEAIKGSKAESGKNFCAGCLVAWREFDKDEKQKAEAEEEIKKE